MIAVKADLDFEGVSKATNLPNPTSAQDAATKAYVDAIGGGGLIETIKTTTATLTSGEFSMVYVVPASATYTITLPTATSVANKVCYLKRQTSTILNTSVRIFSSELIDGEQFYDLEFDEEFVELFSNGTTFRVLGE
jgi:hypothetical protein